NLLGGGSFFGHGEGVTHTIMEIADIGVLVLMVLAGLQVDLKNLFHVGKPALFAGLGGVLVPLIVIPPIVTLFGYSPAGALLLGILFANMSTSITAQVMLELGVIRS